MNGETINTSSTVLVPVSRIPQLQQQLTSPSPSCERKAAAKGLVVGLGVLGALLFVLIATIAWFWLVLFRREKRGRREGEEQKSMAAKNKMEKQRFGFGSISGKHLMADVSECLDKYKLYDVDVLREATSDFDSSCLIQGSVYKGIIEGDVFAIKKMKWDAYEELKILQKVCAIYPLIFFIFYFSSFF